MVSASHAGEVPALTRSCLESAGYAILMAARPALAHTWMERHQTTDGIKAMRKEFTTGAIREAIIAKDKKLAELFDRFYQEAIDLGAHPNIGAVAMSAILKEDGNDTQFLLNYLHPDSIPLDMTFKHTARAGLCALFLFAQIFEARFSLLGLPERLQKLRTNL